MIQNDRAGTYTYQDNLGRIYNQFGQESTAAHGRYLHHDVQVIHDRPDYPLYVLRVLEAVVDYVPEAQMIVAQMDADLREMLWEALEELAPLTGERDNFAITLRAAGGGVVSIVVPLPPLAKFLRPQMPTVDELASDNWLRWVCGVGGW